MEHTTQVQDYKQCQAHLRDPDLRQALYDAGEVVMKDVLLTLHGPQHTLRRRLEMRVFGRSFFRYYEQDVFPRTLNETLEPLARSGQVDLIDFGYRVTINLTADFAGIDRPRRTAEETEDLLAMVKTFSEGATMVHSTRPKGDVEAEVKQALAAFDERFLRASVARRKQLVEEVARGAADESDLPRDVLTVLLKNEDRADLPADVLLREMAFYMQAGSHSTANAMVHAFHEITIWAGDDQTRWERVRSDDAFLHRCVHESLRLHPASPEALRERCPVGGSGHVSTGDYVTLDLFTANRDEAVFGADAASFNPERARPKGVNAAGLSFGTGVHACLGQELDGGVLFKADTPEENRQFGIVTLLVMELLRRHAVPDPADPATAADNTSRPNWGRYPVLLDAL